MIINIKKNLEKNYRNNFLEYIDIVYSLFTNKFILIEFLK